MADWDEVKRLAADFQKVQLSSTTQKLSERNCIEIVTLLTEKKMLELIFTSDGKEYLTPSHLVHEIIGELYVSGGRVNLTELASNIGVDLSRITSHLNEVTKNQKDIMYVLGQLIDATYLSRIASEINEKLTQIGQINISDLTMQYDLPSEFIQSHIIEKNLGKLIFGKQDKNDARIIFTESFIMSTKAKIRGALLGLTSPVSVAAILSKVDISEKLFFSLFDQSSILGCLTSRMVGAQYIPNVYARSQADWVQNVYKLNGYIEYDALIRLGISDYRSYLMKSSLGVQHLSSCAIGDALLERIEADIEECVSSKSHIDLNANMPSVFNTEDIRLVLDKVLTPQNRKETLVLNGHMLSKAFVDNLATECEETLELNEKARRIVESGKYQQYKTDLEVSGKVDNEEVGRIDKREERRMKAAGGKSGGGTQGRETKTKSLKGKKHRQIVAAAGDNDEMERGKVLEVISLQDVKENIQSILEAEGLEDILEDLTQYLHPLMNEKGLAIAMNVYQSTVADRTAVRRQTHNDVQSKLNTLLADIRLFEKGIKLLPLATQPAFYKYLLKSQCTEFANDIVNYISSEEGPNNMALEQFSNEQRLKFVADMKAEYRTPFACLIKALSAPNIDEFVDAVPTALQACSMILKKIDKKKDRNAVFSHKHALMEQLHTSTDPPVVLHLATLILFVSATQNIIHASGRHVVHLLAYLKQFMTAEQHADFNRCYDMVGIVLSEGPDCEIAKQGLSEKIPVIKQIVLDFKKLPSEKS